MSRVESWPSDAPLRLVQNGLEGVRSVTGLPWWGSIVASTVVLRAAATLPVSVFVHRNAARLQIDAAPQLEAWKERIAVELRHKYRHEGKSFEEFEKAFRSEYAGRVKQVMKENGIRGPIFSLAVPLVQIPMWVVVSLTIRRMSAAPLLWFEPLPEPVAGFVDGGIGSCKDLTVPVTSYGIPVAIAAANLFNIYWGSLSRKPSARPLYRYVTNAMKVLSLAMIPAAGSVPSALAVYWLTSSGFSVLQNLALYHPRVRRVFRMRTLPGERGTPVAEAIRLWREGSLASTTWKAIREWKRPMWWRPLR